ncbi:MAG: hypothetical protein PHI98_10840 [Eubacteriales bacterium]|nr:hypothetical protein [Eubacteriales bacterium]
MRMHKRGVVSYAGFDKAALWAQARRAFAQSDETVPQRFTAFLPLFPIELIVSMPYVGTNMGSRALAAESGFSIDPCEYHRQLYAEMPELYTGDNYRRNFDYENRFIGRGAVTVDQAWVLNFPQYQPFVGEKLCIYLIGGGSQAVAVPESIYPRGRGVLHGVELDMGVTARAEHYCNYARSRIEQGDSYDSSRFEAEYLKDNQLESVVIRQSELGQLMQDLSILQSLKEEPSDIGLYTENAKRSEHVAQYIPRHLACDVFESSLITRNTARLLQLYYDGDDFISDFWLPYAEASEYIRKPDMVLDVRALCEGFQIPPRYDPVTHGGLYPSRARVVVVRDRAIRPMVATALNNPAYGSGMHPLGMINKRVFLYDSQELLRMRKLAVEELSLRFENGTASPDEYIQMLARTLQQELKGALTDGMYRRESALRRLQSNAPAYERAKALLDQRVAALESRVNENGSLDEQGQLSGYDADIQYLKRMRQSRERTQEEDGAEPLPFAFDSLRETSIESGYAMRSSLYQCSYEELALPMEPEDEAPVEGLDSPEEEPDNEVAALPEEEPDNEAAVLPVEEPDNEAAALPNEEPDNKAAALPNEEPDNEVVALPNEEPDNEAAALPNEEPDNEAAALPEEEPDNEAAVPPTEEPDSAAVTTPAPVPHTLAQLAKAKPADTSSHAGKMTQLLKRTLPKKS